MLVVESEPVGATGSISLANAKIRRAHFVQWKPIKQIGRELKL